MSDSPHTSAPMVMQGRALVLKNTCRNASSTSVKKHLSWSPDIHPTARWVPSTPHRSRPAGYPPTRHSGAVGAKERECNVGHYVEADDEEETRPSAAVPPSERASSCSHTTTLSIVIETEQLLYSCVTAYMDSSHGPLCLPLSLMSLHHLRRNLRDSHAA